MSIVHRTALGLAILLTCSGARANDLWILMRDGALHRLPEDGGAAVEEKTKFPSPHAIATLPGKVVIAHGDKLVVLKDGVVKEVPGKWSDLRELATGGPLYGTTEKSEILRIDLASGKRTVLGTVVHGRLIAGEDYEVWVGRDEGIERVGTKPSGELVKLSHRPIAMAGSGGMSWVITKDGKLWQIAGGKAKELDAFGNWWAALAMSASGAKLYVATQAGKLWRLDVSSGAKDALAMDGWQNVYGLAVAR